MRTSLEGVRTSLEGAILWQDPLVSLILESRGQDSSGWYPTGVEDGSGDPWLEAPSGHFKWRHCKLRGFFAIYSRAVLGQKVNRNLELKTGIQCWNSSGSTWNTVLREQFQEFLTETGNRYKSWHHDRLCEKVGLCIYILQVFWK